MEYARFFSGRNLVTNPGFENTSLWSEVGYANFPGTSFFRSNWGIAAPRSGSYAYAISNHVYGYLQSQSIPVRAGTEYDVYAWVRGDLDADDSNGDWLLRAQFYTAGGTPINPPTDVDRGAVSGLSAAWQQQGGRVTAPDNAATMKIQLYNYMNSGWVAFDDVTIASEFVARRYYYAGSARVAMRQGWGTGSTGLSYLLGDHLGSTSLVTDGSGQNPVTQLYKAWGEVRWSSASLPTQYTFTGQYSYVTDFGLLFFKARFYDPALGRFAQADSIVPGAGNPMAWDRYAGMLNNPLRYLDPSGHDPVCGQAYSDPECNPDYIDPYVPPKDSALTYNGAKVALLFEKLKAYKSGWWYSGGNFTIELFMGLWILHEANGNAEIAEILSQVVAQNLYVGGYNPAYCALTTCMNGAFNFMAAQSKLGGGLFGGTDDLSKYTGPTSLGSDPWTMEDVAGYGNTALHPIHLDMDRNDAQSNWGNATEWTVSMRSDDYNIHEGWPPNGTGRLTVYYFNGSFVVFTLNQRFNWSLRGVDTAMDKVP